MTAITTLVAAAGAAAYITSTDPAPQQPQVAAPRTELRQSATPAAAQPKHVSPKEEQPAPAPPKVKAPAHIAGVNAISLTDAQLERLGVRRTASGYEIFARVGVDFNNPAPLAAYLANSDNNRSGVVFDQSKMRSVVRQFGGEISANTGNLTLRVSFDSLGMRSRAVHAKEFRAVMYPLVITHESADVSGTEKSAAMLFGSPDDSVRNQEQYRAELVQLFDLYNPKPDRRSRSAGNHPLVGKLIPVRISMGGEHSPARARRPSSGPACPWARCSSST